MNKPRKYHYNFCFKRGNYRDVCGELAERYSKFFSGSGVFLLDGSFDVSFICTSGQANNISRYIRRNLPKAAMSRMEV